VPPRLRRELELLRRRYPDLVFVEAGWWVLVPKYSLPKGWSQECANTAFQIPAAYPGTPPYGFYVPFGLRFDGKKPDNYQEPGGNKPPFEGEWGMFSWSIDGTWQTPTTDFIGGENLCSFVLSFAERFAMGV